MKKIIILMVLISITLASMGQTSQKDSLKIVLLEYRIKNVERNLTNASLCLIDYQEYRDISKAFLLFGVGFSTLGSGMLYEYTKDSRYQDLKYMSIGAYVVSGILCTASLIYQIKAFNKINDAGIQLGIGMNRVHVKYKF